LVYIGSSGKKTPEGKIKVRKGRAGMTGIKGRLIQGSQKRIPRYNYGRNPCL